MDLLLGIDLGSSALKATLIGECEGICLTRSAEYDEDWVGECPEHLERNVEVYWRALTKVVRGFIGDDHVRPEDIKGISFSVQGETLVPVDGDFRPVRKTIQGHDVRAQEEVKILREQFGDAPLYPVTGQPMIDGYWPAVKVLWIKRHQPEIFARTRYIMLLEDYIIHRLTGRFVTDRCLVADSYYYDMTAGTWFAPMLAFLGLTPEMLPTVLKTGEVVGPISEAAARETGLATRTQVVAGAMDQIAGAVGAGNVRPGVITETTGTALAIGVTGTGDYSRLVRTGLPLYYHALADAYFLMPWLASGGLSLQWFARSLLEKESGDDLYTCLTQKAERVPAGADGLIMLPFLLGATCPEFDSDAKGVFAGITPGHTQGHFVRAILEAIGYAIRANMELIQSAGIPVTAIRSFGGGARSRLWSQIKADICKAPVTVMDVADTASLGAALIAGAGVGVYSSMVETHASRFIKTRETFMPNPAAAAIYDRGFQRYRAIYQALKGSF